jgi:hypothetical protein
VTYSGEELQEMGFDFLMTLTKKTKKTAVFTMTTRLNGITTLPTIVFSARGDF